MIKIVKFSILFSICLFSVEFANAQLNSIGEMLSGATSDAGKLIPAYIKPYASAFGADLSSGWYNTAKPHKLLGFDLTLSVSAAFVPSSDKTFDLSSLGPLTGSISNGTVTPTVAHSSGSSINNPLLTYNTSIAGKNYPVAEFHMPSGTGVGIIPAPILQLGIGLIKGTEVDVRYVPNLEFGNDLSVQLWGIGIKHSIKQWIPGISLAPFFNLSVFAGYTQFKTDVKLNFKPIDLSNAISPNSPDTQHITPSLYTNQQLQLLVNNFTGNIIASFDLPVVTFYGGVGFCYTSTTLKVNGTYPGAEVPEGEGKVVVDDNARISNPINASMTSSSGGATKPRLNAGVRFKFAVITLHVDYTLANYSVLTAGLGVSFR